MNLAQYNRSASTNTLIQCMIQANKIIVPLGGKIIRHNKKFEYENRK